MAAPRKLLDRFVETAVDDEILLVDMEGGVLFALDGTAAAIWRSIDGQRDCAAMAAALAREFDAEAVEIERDCRALVGELAGAGLVAAPDAAC